MKTKYIELISAAQIVGLVFFFYMVYMGLCVVVNVAMSNIHIIMFIVIALALIGSIVFLLFLLSSVIQYCLDYSEGSKLIPILYITLINAIYTAFFISIDNSRTLSILSAFCPFLIISAIVGYCYRFSKEAEAYESSDSDDAPSDFYEKQKEMF